MFTCFVWWGCLLFMLEVLLFGVTGIKSCLVVTFTCFALNYLGIAY